jgi:hypothetical protein
VDEGKVSIPAKSKPPSLADGAPVWYRLTKQVPFELRIGKTTYTVKTYCRAPNGSGQWELIAAFHLGEVLVSEVFAERLVLERAVETCFCTRHLRGGEAIMEGAVRQGYAMRMESPAVTPQHGQGQPWLR